MDEEVDIAKACTVNVENDLGFFKRLDEYHEFVPVLREAESYSNDHLKVIAKWDKITNEGKREYDQCLGAPFLLYLYYRFDNKPTSYYLLWRLSDILRNVISRLPFKIKYIISQLIALFVYLPLARTTLLLDKIGINVSNFPLTWYKNEPFYIMRTDALDRFGTSLEQRFTKDEISKMLLNAGFENIKFSDREPFWTVLSYKK